MTFEARRLSRTQKHKSGCRQEPTTRQAAGGCLCTSLLMQCELRARGASSRASKQQTWKIRFTQTSDGCNQKIFFRGLGHYRVFSPLAWEGNIICSQGPRVSKLATRDWMECIMQPIRPAQLQLAGVVSVLSASRRNHYAGQSAARRIRLPDVVPGIVPGIFLASSLASSPASATLSVRAHHKNFRQRLVPHRHAVISLIFAGLCASLSSSSSPST